MNELGKLMEQAWSSLEEVCSQLSPDDWSRPTDCPGWDVKDQLAHVASLEAIALGRPMSTAEPAITDHVRNDIGALNERELEARRALTPERILDEYRDVTTERAKVLASWTDEEWNEEGQGILGRSQRSNIISIRIVDVFVHDQDVRLATGNPGGLNGDVARFVAGRMRDAMGFVLAKRAQAGPDDIVVFEIGPPGETFAVGMAGGRGVRLEETPDDPTARIAMDGEAFLRLTAGRVTPDELERDGRLRVAGDRAFADRVLAGMNIMV